MKEIYKNTAKKLDILGVLVDSKEKGQLLKCVRERLTINSRIIITTPNPEIVLRAQKDEHLKSILNNSDIAIADGVGLKIAHKNVEIIKGREFFLDLLGLANEKKWRVFLLGGTSEVSKQALAVLHERFPKVIFDGDSGPYYTNDALPSKKQKKEHIKIINNIESYKPHMLFVALGCPKQEYWIDNYLSKLSVGLAMGVGGTFDFLAGISKLPPKVISERGLEWIWRLIHDPKRLKRIINAVVVFPLNVFVQKVSGNHQYRDSS